MLDDDYVPILQAIPYCLIRFGFNPSIATERVDSGETRLEKIKELIRGSNYSIHDLSRCQSSEPNELHLMNMPFELGLNFGCRNFDGSPHEKGSWYWKSSETDIRVSFLTSPEVTSKRTKANMSQRFARCVKG